MDSINLDALRVATAGFAPFPHVIVPGFIREARRESIQRDFPDVRGAGSFPCNSLSFGPAFDALIREIQSEEMTTMVAEKLKIDLRGRPTMVTVRGWCRPGDGRIHRDSHGKLVTALLYMNGKWEANGGQLRLLNGAGNLDDYFAEVPPDQGTLLLFRCVDNAWHGHESFKGLRRTIQLNWVRDAAYARRESRRHAWSAALKKIGHVFRAGSEQRDGAGN